MKWLKNPALFGLVALTQLFRNAAPRAASEPKTGA